MTNPESMVFISGIPEPEARYIVLPVNGVSVLELSSQRWLPCPGAAAGKVDLVSMVSEELMIPYANAKATYIANARYHPLVHICHSSHPSPSLALVEPNNGRRAVQQASRFAKGFEVQ